MHDIPPYKRRIIAELEQVLATNERLKAFNQSEQFNLLPDIQRGLYREKEATADKYASVLKGILDQTLAARVFVVDGPARGSHEMDDIPRIGETIHVHREGEMSAAVEIILKDADGVFIGRQAYHEHRKSFTSGFTFNTIEDTTRPFLVDHGTRVCTDVVDYIAIGFEFASSHEHPWYGVRLRLGADEDEIAEGFELLAAAMRERKVAVGGRTGREVNATKA